LVTDSSFSALAFFFAGFVIVLLYFAAFGLDSYFFPLTAPLAIFILF